MPLVRVLFKGNKAYARADEAGELIVEKGRVEVMYKPGDAHRYKVALANVTPLPGEALRPDPPEAPEAEAAPKPPKAKKSAPKKASAPVAGSEIVAYTDGACSGNPGEAGSGLVLISGAHRLEISRYLGKSTNNVAELFGIKLALLSMKDKRRPLAIHSDSSYALGLLTRGWKAKKNPELVAEILELLAQFSAVRFVKVEGHAGVSENERADQLARMAVSLRKDSEMRYYNGQLVP